MRLDALIAAAALTLGVAVPVAVAQQPGQPAPSAAPPAAAPPAQSAGPGPGGPALPTGQQPATGATEMPPPRDPFPPDWTGRPQSAADAQREARAAASEALKECRRQAGADAQRCAAAVRRDKPPSVRRASPPPSSRSSRSR